MIRRLLNTIVSRLQSAYLVAQFDLFAAGVKDPNQLAETLARVEAVLGSERFGVPAMHPTHHPDKFDIRPFCVDHEPEAIHNPQPTSVDPFPSANETTAPT